MSYRLLHGCMFRFWMSTGLMIWVFCVVCCLIVSLMCGFCFSFNLTTKFGKIIDIHNRFLFGWVLYADFDRFAGGVGPISVNG